MLFNVIELFRFCILASFLRISCVKRFFTQLFADVKPFMSWALAPSTGKFWFAAPRSQTQANKSANPIFPRLFPVFLQLNNRHLSRSGSVPQQAYSTGNIWTYEKKFKKVKKNETAVNNTSINAFLITCLFRKWTKVIYPLLDDLFLRQNRWSTVTTRASEDKIISE